MSLTFHLPRDTLIISFPVWKKILTLLRTLLFLDHHHDQVLGCGEVLTEQRRV